MTSFAQPSSGGSVFSGYFNQYHQNVYGVPAPQYSVNDMMTQRPQPMMAGGGGGGGGEQENGPAQQLSDAYGYYNKAKNLQQMMKSPWSAGDGTGAWAFENPMGTTADFAAPDMGASGMTGFTPAPTAEASYGAGTGMFPAGTAAPAGGAEAGAGMGLGAMAGAVGAGMGGMYAYDQSGMGHGYQDFMTGDWTNELTNSGLDMGGLDMSGMGGDISNMAQDGMQLFTAGQGTNPMNPMTWVKWGGDIADMFGDLF